MAPLVTAFGDGVSDPAFAQSAPPTRPRTATGVPGDGMPAGGATARAAARTTTQASTASTPRTLRRSPARPVSTGRPGANRPRSSRRNGNGCTRCRASRSPRPTRRVTWESTVSVEAVRYSVPHELIDTRVWARFHGDELIVTAIDEDGSAREVARHQHGEPGSPVLDDGHYPPRLSHSRSSIR